MCRNRRNVDNRPTVRLLSAVDELFLICIMYGSYLQSTVPTKQGGIFCTKGGVIKLTGRSGSKRPNSCLYVASHSSIDACRLTKLSHLTLAEAIQKFIFVT